MFDAPLVRREETLDLAYWPDFLDRPTADRVQACLIEEVPWAVHTVRLFGRQLPSPRLSSWHGDPGAGYRYSGVRHAPQVWTSALLEMRARLRDWLGEDFNSVLCNRYRDGADAMGWHADDEPELGPEPIVASLSFGAARDFVLKPRSGGTRRERLALGHGSLLVMRGPTQQHWLHALPRRRHASERINLSFRQLHVPLPGARAGSVLA